MRKIYGYSRCSHEDLENMTRWLQNQLCLRDWTIEIYSGDAPKWSIPPENEDDIDLGETVVDMTLLRAKVWVDLRACKIEDRNPRQIMAHEMLHVLQESCGVVDEIYAGISTQDRVCYTLDSILYEVYCRNTKRKLGPLADQ